MAFLLRSTSVLAAVTPERRSWHENFGKVTNDNLGRIIEPHYGMPSAEDPSFWEKTLALLLSPIVIPLVGLLIFGSGAYIFGCARANPFL